MAQWSGRSSRRRSGTATAVEFPPMQRGAGVTYLRESGYRTYIVTGGGQEFVRAIAERVSGVPPEQVIGSAGQTKYGYGKDGQPMLVKVAKVLLIDDKAGKPKAITLIIGRRPYAAFGNSTGDQQAQIMRPPAAASADGARVAITLGQGPGRCDPGRRFPTGRPSWPSAPARRAS